jgi:hypothetical protein
VRTTSVFLPTVNFKTERPISGTAYEGRDGTAQGSQELAAVTDWLRLGHEHIRELFDSKVKAEKALALAQEERKEKEEMLLKKLVIKRDAR